MDDINEEGEYLANVEAISHPEDHHHYGGLFFGKAKQEKEVISAYTAQYEEESSD